MKNRLALRLAFIVLVSACRTQEAPTPDKPGPAASAADDRSGKEVEASAQPAQSCWAEIGAKAAAELVHQCKIASPATHPPCNEGNSCALIREEIERGCNFIGTGDTPDFCSKAIR